MRDDEASRPAGGAGGRKKINLALQGGGAHGAFTWGVLDRLLAEPDIDIEGVSATSAGAMNAAMLTTGIKVGGREEARRRLKDFWRRIRNAHPLNQQPFAFWRGLAPGLYDAGFEAAYLMGDVLSRVASPYQLNPTNINPLRKALEETIDFSVVQRSADPRLFICATDVRRGRPKIFSGDEISVDALLASACLPMVYQAVEIDGVEYWDGGYTGNPPIWPLIYECESPDVLLVQINPIERATTPRDAAGILNRVNEISFNSNLMFEMRAIHMVGRLLDEAELSPDHYKRMRMHAIEDEETMRRLSVATKLTPDWGMMKELRDAGRAAMSRWLAAKKHLIGVDHSVDVAERYL